MFQKKKKLAVKTIMALILHILLVENLECSTGQYFYSLWYATHMIDCCCQFSWSWSSQGDFSSLRVCFNITSNHLVVPLMDVSVLGYVLRGWQHNTWIRPHDWCLSASLSPAFSLYHTALLKESPWGRIGKWA